MKIAELTSQAHETTATAVADKLPPSLKEPGAIPTLKELFETLDLTYPCCPTEQHVYYSGSTTSRDQDGAAQPAQQDRDTGPLLMATRRAVNDCIVLTIGLQTDPANCQAYRDTVREQFDRLGRKGFPKPTKEDNEKVAGILNAKWQLFERWASGVKLSECCIGKMVLTRRRKKPRVRRTSTEEEQDDHDQEDEEDSPDTRSWKVENAVRATTRNLGFIDL